MPISAIKVRNLKSKDKPCKVSDFEGLFVLVKVSGSKSWRFKYRIDGKETLLLIGDYRAASIPARRTLGRMGKACKVVGWIFG